MSTTPTVAVRIELADAQPGDQVWQAGQWQPVAAFHIFGSRKDMVKLVWPNGGSMAMPASHCPTITRLVDACASCEKAPAGHGHFALYCETCSELPYWEHPAPTRVGVCEEESRTGTGPRVCLTELDAHGQCPNAARHTQGGAR
jgi:hypothetical protein